MPRLSTVVAVVASIVIVVIFNAFQCSSSEMTTAKLAIQQKNPEKADTSLTRELEKNPQNAEAWYLLGRVNLDLGRYEKMVRAYTQALALTNEYTKQIVEDKHFVWGQSLNQGVALYNRSISAPDDSVAIYRQRAIDQYETALLVNPDSAITYHRLAIAHLAMGNVDEEIRNLREAIAREKSIEYYTLLIDAQLRKGQEAADAGNTEEAMRNFNMALTDLDEARKIEPENEDLLRSMIDLYIRVDRAEDAKPAMREALVKDPNNKVYHYNLGVLLLQSDSLAEAAKHFDAAIATDSSYDVALHNGGIAYLRWGDEIRRAEREKAEAKGAKTAKVDEREYMDKFRAAVRILERLVTVKQDDPVAWDALATAYGNAGMIKDAERAIKKADELRKKG